MNLVKTEFKSTFALACLKELKQKQDDLLDDLTASMALEQFIPNVFDNGGVKVKVRSKGNKYTTVTLSKSVSNVSSFFAKLYKKLFL